MSAVAPPQTPLGSLQCSPAGLDGFKGPNSKGEKGWEKKGGEQKGMRQDGRKGDPRGWFTPRVRNPEKYPDCRTDLMSGAATQTFVPGGKQPRAATE